MTATSAVHDARTHHAMAVVAALVGSSAWYGAAGLATGFLRFPARLSEQLPFASPVFGGLALAVVVAVPYCLLALLAWRGDRRTEMAAAACGLAMVGWITVELLFLQELSFLHPLMAAVGVGFVLAGRRALRRPTQVAARR
jgi:hypothetical protein